MAFLHQLAIDAADATVAQKTKAYDCLRVSTAGFSFTLAGMTDTISQVAKLQVSNQVPPDGLFPGQSPPAGTLGTSAWAPDETSWVDATRGNASVSAPVAVSATFSAVGVKQMQLSGADLAMRWVRGVTVPSTGTGGTMTIEALIRSPGDL